MQKIYLLLRNNKQSGPHSLEELVALPLKRTDLLWVEGRSKSWDHPVSIDELKTYVSEEKQATESITVYPKADKKLVLPRTSPAQQQEKKQEAFKVQVYVKLPDTPQGDAHSTDKYQSESELTGRMDQENYTLSTKYVRDLDEIKEQYSAWIRKQKTNPKDGIEKKKLVIAAVVMLLVTAVFIFEKWGSNSADTRPKLKAGTIKVVQNPATPETTKTAKSKKSSRTADSKKNKSNKAAALASSAAEERKKDNEGEKHSETEKQEAGSESKINATTLFKKLDIKYSRDENAEEGVSGLLFTLHNGNDQKLNTVGLSIYYYDSSENVVSKETIYFNNLQAGSSGSQAAPDNRQAFSVTYKIAMVSVNDSIFYGKD